MNAILKKFDLVSSMIMVFSLEKKYDNGVFDYA